MNEEARKLIAAVICDLAAYLNQLPEPIVIGGQYGTHNSKLFKAVADWTVLRQITLTDPSAEDWVLATTMGMFNGKGPNESDKS